jgi:hypothetical protein
VTLAKAAAPMPSDRLTQAILAQRPELLADGVPCGAVTVLKRTSDRWRLIELPSTTYSTQGVQRVGGTWVSRTPMPSARSLWRERSTMSG